MMAPRLLRSPPSATGTKPLEIQQRAIGEERQQQFAAGKAGDAADDARERVARKCAGLRSGRPSARAAKLSSAIARKARADSVRGRDIRGRGW